MGNLFMGFPVPYAKIAGMVEEAGGIGSTYEDTALNFHTHFESKDGFSQLSGGGGSVTMYHIYMLLDTSTSSSGYAKFYKGTSYIYPVPTWDKAFKFRTAVRFRCDNDKTGDVYIVRGTVGAYPHVGFFVNDGILKGISRNGSAVSTVTLETLGAAAYDVERRLEVVFTPAVKAEFYVDGTKLGEITTNLPAGTGYANYYFYLHVLTNGNSKRFRFYISEFRLYQAE